MCITGLRNTAKHLPARTRGFDFPIIKTIVKTLAKTVAAKQFGWSLQACVGASQPVFGLPTRRLAGDVALRALVAALCQMSVLLGDRPFGWTEPASGWRLGRALSVLCHFTLLRGSHTGRKRISND